MRTLFRIGLVTLSSLLFFTANATAKRIALPSLPDRIGRADAILTGKVSALEEKKIKLPGGGEGILATVKVENALFGAKGLTHAKVAIQAGSLESGQEGCFFLHQVKGESYFTLGNRAYFSMIRKEDGNYDEQLSAIKRSAGFLADPAKGLKAKAVEDRLLTAVLLLSRYRPMAETSAKTEAIDADQSKLILEALAEADWKKFDNVTRISPSATFYRLGLTVQDGWKQPEFQNLETAAKEWLKANAGNYRIKRFVFAEK